MKFVTPALVREDRRPKGLRRLFYKPEMQDAFYQAKHREQDCFLLWVEANRMGSLHAFPSILEEDGKLYVFESLKDKSLQQKQEEMLHRWNERISPQTAKTDFEISTLTELEFDCLYAQYRKRYAEEQDELIEANGL